MELFCQMKPIDSRAIQHIKNPNYIKGLENKTKLFDVENPIFYTEGISDFGAVLTDLNELYFTSNSNESSKLDSRTAQPFLDIYKAELQSRRAKSLEQLHQTRDKDLDKLIKVS
jgi:hypothetical protein